VLERIEPYGELRMDFRFALLAQHLVTALGVRDKNKQPFKVADFMLQFPDEQLSAEEAREANIANIERAFRMWATAANERFKRQPN
jgi:hypothetical protein